MMIAREHHALRRFVNTFRQGALLRRLRWPWIILCFVAIYAVYHVVWKSCHVDWNPKLIHKRASCQKTLHFPFRVGCPADCRPYSGAETGYRLTMEWYFGQPKKYNPRIPLRKQRSNYSLGINFQCPEEFVRTFQKASRDVVRKGNLTIPKIRFRLQKRMHLSLLYLCCLREDQIEEARTVLQDIVDQWSKKVTVRFDEIQCWYETPSSVTTIVTVDKKSQCELMKLLRLVEQRLEAHDIPVLIPRKDQMPFHVTLVGLRYGLNVESYKPEYNLSSQVPVIYDLVHETSKEYKGKWNPMDGMIIAHAPKLSSKTENHTYPLSDLNASLLLHQNHIP